MITKHSQIHTDTLTHRHIACFNYAWLHFRFYCLHHYSSTHKSACDWTKLYYVLERKKCESFSGFRDNKLLVTSTKQYQYHKHTYTHFEMLYDRLIETIYTMTDDKRSTNIYLANSKDFNDSLLSGKHTVTFSSTNERKCWMCISTWIVFICFFFLLLLLLLFFL